MDSKPTPLNISTLKHRLVTHVQPLSQQSETGWLDGSQCKSSQPGGKKDSVAVDHETTGWSQVQQILVREKQDVLVCYKKLSPFYFSHTFFSSGHLFKARDTIAMCSMNLCDSWGCMPASRQ